MTPEQSAALLFSQSACAIVEALGAFSENMQRIHIGESIAYNSNTFDDIINRYGIGFNSAVALLQGR
jgi:hypothetical protein